jgi:UDP-glucose 4-epimerase
MKAVVFGGSGFLGSHVADALSDHGYETYIFDLNKSQWLNDDQIMLQGDILDESSVASAVKDADVVYHLAGMADIGEAAGKPYDTMQINIMGSMNLIDACIAANVKRFMYASTVYVYSNKGSFYRISKQAVESILEAYNENHGIEYTILRYGSLYGPRAQEWNGLKNFVVQGIRDGKIIYPGTGEERREYIHVKDAAKLSVNVLSSEYANTCLTLTGSQVMTTREAMQIIREIASRDMELEFIAEGSIYQQAHYSITPYRYTPKQGKKVVPATFIDIGEGILELIEEVYQEANNVNDSEVI